MCCIKVICDTFKEMPCKPYLKEKMKTLQQILTKEEIVMNPINQSQPMRTNGNGNGTKSVSVVSENTTAVAGNFNQNQIQILKNSICKGLTDDEFQVFLMACNKTQLDPFMKQIYALKRKSKKPDGSWGEVMTIQTGIDGYRLIAERTEKYAPGEKPSFEYDASGNLIEATAYIKKMTKDGTWHVVSCSAHIDDYCQKKDGKAMGQWATMPRIMLAKCAEALALRKAFPAEMSGIYTKEEMDQSDNGPVKISLEQAAELENMLSECTQAYQDWVYSHIEKTYKTSNWTDVPLEVYSRIKVAAANHKENEIVIENQSAN